MKLAPSLALALAACSPYAVHGTTTPPMPAFGPSPPDVATVCVVRPSQLARAVTFVIHDGPALVGATRGPSYFCYLAEPGDHRIASDTFDRTDHPAAITARLAPGARYWLYQDYDNDFGSITSKLSWIDEASARSAIDGCEYEVITGAPAHEPLPAQVPFAPAARMATATGEPIAARR